ncbi:MAG: hypothetical protein BroJett011_03710 [Chloroflexota bacterium]|nr:MAG: hypothetical protein BroJett011_03710 [Chloroflexota bacterium]
MSQALVTLTLNTTEENAALLLETLVERVQETPSLLPTRADWLDLAEQVAIGLAVFQAGLAPRARPAHGEQPGQRVKVDDCRFVAERA